MKKHKKILICLTIMLAFIAAIVTGYVSNAASNYNPSESQFVNDKAINLLGRNLNSGGKFWKNLYSKGMLSCFYHKASQPTQGMNTKIHSVFDIQFDEEKGAMKVTSIINDGKRTPKVTYVTDQNGKVVANLVAQASKKGNARMVYEALRKAINAGVVVKESAINHQQYWWPNGTKNPAGKKEIGNYAGYRKVTKDETVVAKSIKEVTINNKSYTVLGCFKMTFAGKGISSVQVGNAKWTPNSKSNEIYVYSKLTGEKWTTDFNKLKSANSYALNGRSFYLAVETSKLPSNGSFDVTITQDKFQYTNARIVVCVGTKQQQTGLYCYDNSPSTFEGQVKWSIKQENVLTAMEIIKKDETTGEELADAKFKVYAELADGTKGWLSGEADGIKTYGKEMTEYEAKEIIKNLKYGTYYIYETKTPEGYNIKKQQGYHKEAAGSSELSGDWVYLGSQVINVNSPANDIFTFSAPNKKVVEIEGKVWQDVDNSKGNTLDYVYKKETGDILKQGITVNLYNGQNQLIATEKTANDGTYKFTTKNAPSYTGTDKDLTYSDLTNSYIEFIYNNKTTYDNEGKAKEYGYIAVDPFVGTDASINSKAQEETITTVKLDDNNLTGTTGNNPGRAVTKRNLTEYFDNATYKVSNINLGLMEQHDAQFNVGEELAYIKVKMKGYTYTYKYGDASKTTSTNVPTVNEQNSTRTYTGKIYPTDIAYNMAESTEELKVYAIYKINVQNTDTVNIDNQYVEERLYLDSLESTFDTDRYELCTDQNNEDKSDFALWSNAGDGKAKYDVNNNNSQFKDGITKLETKTSYIQFKLKDAAVKRILTNSTEPNIERAPTVATAKGYHEYLRTDNAWNHNDNIVAYEGSKGVSNYPKKNNSGEKYYVHKTISKTSSSSALYLKLSLGEARQISGTVFEDTRTDESKKANTNLGNGIIESSENNRANNVTVELLNADKTTVTKLYKEKDGKVVYEEDGKLPEARTQTGADGSFKFEGVVPGYYYIRFTYGDGTQKMLPANSVIKSNDYKSTIVNTETNGAGDIIKNAMEISSTALENAQQTLLKDYTNEQAKKLVEWYKYLNNNSYSVAVDDQAQRLQNAGYEYREDGKVYDKDGKEITNYIKNINAYTPILGISIENDVNNSTDEGNVQSANYNAFNFGIIKEKDTIVTLDKKITNVNLTNQVGSTVVSANPADKTNAYLTALDKITGGSKQAKLEIESNMIYGSALKTTYEITIKNESSKDYIEDENSDKFGYYYKYGDITDTAKLKELTINKVKDELDKKYKYDTSMSTIKEIVVHENNVTNESNVKVEQESTADENGSSNALAITGWSKLESGAKASVTYDVTSLLSAEDDTAYGNEAKIASVSLDMLEALNSNFDWSKNDKTTISIVPSTGADRSNIYVIAGVVALVVISSGLFFLKKKVLK